MHIPKGLGWTGSAFVGLLWVGAAVAAPGPSRVLSVGVQGVFFGFFLPKGVCYRTVETCRETDTVAESKMQSGPQ